MAPTLKDIKTMVKIDTSGLEKLIEKTREKVSVEVIKPAMTEYAARIEATAKELVPVRTGLLRDSIHTTISEAGHFAKVRTNAKTAPHGFLVHFGSVKSEGTPFLHQARDAHPKSELVQLIEEKKKALKE